MNKIVKSGLHLLIISAITAIFGVLTVFGVSAEVGDTFDVGNLTYRVTSEGAFPTVEVESCNRNVEGAVDIPCVVTNNETSYSVISIGESAFFGCSSLTSVMIPESVTSIGDYAFSYCPNLAEIISYNSSPAVLGKEVLGYHSYYYVKVYIPSMTKSTYVKAGWPEHNLYQLAFVENTIEGAPIKYGILTLDKNSKTGTVEVSKFYDTAYRGGVTIPETVKYKGFSFTVKSIGDFAFSHYGRITSVTIPNSVELIEDEAFNGCQGLTEVNFDSDSKLETIGKNAFSSCKKLTQFSIPSNVKNIGDGAFKYSNSLGKVVIESKNVPNIGVDIFGECPVNLKIYIPYGTKDAYINAGWPEGDLAESVKVVDESGNPIEGAEVTIYLKEYTPVALTKGYTNSEGIYTCPVDISCDTIEVKKSGYKKVETRVSDKFELVVVMEGSSEFTCKTVEGADITYRITSDKTVAVVSCDKKYHGAVTLPESVTNPYNNSEYSVTSIGNDAFKYCFTITNIAIPDSVTSIGDSAFYGCEDLTSVTLGDSVTSIGDYAFANCSSLFEMHCDGLEPPYLGSGVFDNCASNLKIYISIQYGTKEAYVDVGWPEANLVSLTTIVL